MIQMKMGISRTNFRAIVNGLEENEGIFVMMEIIYSEEMASKITKLITSKGIGSYSFFWELFLKGVEMNKDSSLLNVTASLNC